MKNLISTLFIVFGLFIGFTQESLSISSESVLTVDGSSTLHDWTVTANTLNGSLVLDNKLLKEIYFEVEVASIISERGATMGKKMHNALKKEEYPFVKFKAGNIEVEPSEVLVIEGKITIAGVEKEIAIPVAITQYEGKLQIAGAQKIVLQEYNMKPPKAMFGSIVVGDEVTVNFDLIFAKE